MADDLKKAARNYLREIGAKGGKKSSSKLTAAQRRERARLAGIASGKARKKK